jgi:hypothetical protein
MQCRQKPSQSDDNSAPERTGVDLKPTRVIRERSHGLHQWRCRSRGDASSTQRCCHVDLCRAVQHTTGVACCFPSTEISAVRIPRPSIRHRQSNRIAVMGGNTIAGVRHAATVNRLMSRAPLGSEKLLSAHTLKMGPLPVVETAVRLRRAHRQEFSAQAMSKEPPAPTLKVVR